MQDTAPDIAGMRRSSIKIQLGKQLSGMGLNLQQSGTALGGSQFGHHTNSRVSLRTAANATRMMQLRRTSNAFVENTDEERALGGNRQSRVSITANAAGGVLIANRRQSIVNMGARPSIANMARRGSTISITEMKTAHSDVAFRLAGRRKSTANDIFKGITSSNIALLQQMSAVNMHQNDDEASVYSGFTEGSENENSDSESDKKYSSSSSELESEMTELPNVESSLPEVEITGDEVLQAEWDTIIQRHIDLRMAPPDQRDETVWPRDTLFDYLEAMEKLMENLHEREEICRLVSYALLNLHDTDD